MDIRALRGTYDIYPPQSFLWQHIEKKARDIFSRFGYGEMRTPIFEQTSLFSRSIGENTDIVNKEMYTFSDRKGRSLTLRPEATAPVVRAYLQHKIHQSQPFNRFFYIGPMFRYERPQAGRNRQFYQLGTEIIGSNHPYYDAESIALSVSFFESVGINNPTVKINSVGCKKCKPVYNQILKDHFKSVYSDMCRDCNTRYEHNTLRMLDCKNKSCREQIKTAPPILEHLCDECSNHFEQVKKSLAVMNISYQIDSCMVRGLDYYTNTIFEIVHNNLGSQDALGGGGRYNNLIEEMGGPSTGAVGFAIGIDRLVIVLEQLNNSEIGKSNLDLYILNLEKSKFQDNVKLVHDLRIKGLKADLCTEEKSMKAQFRNANRLNAQYVLIQGKEELDKNIVKLKNMINKTEEEIPVDKNNSDQLTESILKRIKKQ